MNDKAEYRSSSWEAGKNGKITGYALVFNQRTVLYKDPETGIEYGEQIDRHALDGADLSDVVLKYNHAGHVLARTRNSSLTLSIDDHGLKIEADMTGSEKARSFLEEIKNGLLDKMSFAFTVAPNGESWDETTRTRTVLHISRLFDVSVVDRPAYEQTEVSARSVFKALAEPEHNRIVCAARLEKLETMDVDELRTRSAEIAELLKDPDANRTVLDAETAFISKRMEQYKAEQERRAKLATVANGAGEAFYTQDFFASQCFGKGSATASNNTFATRKDKNMNNPETRTFYSDLMEKRAAGTTGTMSSVIPETILDNYVIETAPGAFLMDSQTTSIAHSGNLVLPIATLQDISEHEENAEITANGYVPGTLEISHKEYAYNVAYSRIGMQLSVTGFMNIISNTLMNSMMKKMDGICYDAVAGLAYDTGNSVTVSGAPALADFVAAAGKLPTDYINRAKWYMNSGTYFNWMMGLTDINKKPVFDPSKKIEEQALLGYPLAIDSQIPDNTVYFGDGSRVHLNYADPVQLVLWTDHDHNTEKAGVNTVAGAAVEVGSFVKLSK